MDTLQALLIQLPILIFSVVVHEVAHGWVALKQGDRTAQMLGRITLNPLPHIDPIGSILVPGILALTPGGFILGWAKPVPVNPRNYKEYVRGDILVSLAGVVSNLLLAFVFTFLLAAVFWVAPATATPDGVWGTLAQMFQFGILINVILMLFNLIPIPPLDGSHVLYHLLPPQVGARYRELGRYGMIILLAFLFLGGFAILRWPIALFMSFFESLLRVLT